MHCLLNNRSSAYRLKHVWSKQCPTSILLRLGISGKRPTWSVDKMTGGKMGSEARLDFEAPAVPSVRLCDWLVPCACCPKRGALWLAGSMCLLSQACGSVIGWSRCTCCRGWVSKTTFLMCGWPWWMRSLWNHVMRKGEQSFPLDGGASNLCTLIHFQGRAGFTLTDLQPFWPASLQFPHSSTVNLLSWSPKL